MRICLVLGAGASLANARYFQPQRRRNVHPPLDANFFDTASELGISLPEVLGGYLTDLLGAEFKLKGAESRMEDIFKDLFYDFQASQRSARLRTAYTELVTLYADALRRTTNWLAEDSRSGAPVGRLLASALERATDLTVITFNHDLIIENEIHRRQRASRLWCLEHGYGSIAEHFNLLSELDEDGLPREGDHDLRHHDDECNHEIGLTVLKLHGSLNWFVRMQGNEPTASLLTGKAGSTEVLVIPNREIVADVNFVLPGTGRGRRRWRTWPVIVPPIYAKDSLIGRVQESWEDARVAVRRANRLVFFGYSLPEIDIQAEKLFQRGVSRNSGLQWVDVINPATDTAERFAELFRRVPLRWYPDAERFLELDRFE